MNRLQNEGYYGGVRLVMAICKVFFKYCKDNKIDLHKGNFTLSYDTNIPRQVQSFFFFLRKKRKKILVFFLHCIRNLFLIIDRISPKRVVRWIFLL